MHEKVVLTAYEAKFLKKLGESIRRQRLTIVLSQVRVCEIAGIPITERPQFRQSVDLTSYK